MHLSADKLLPWIYPKVDCRLAFVDTLQGTGGSRAFPFGRGGTGGRDDPLLVREAELDAPRALPLARVELEERAIW